MEKRYVVAQGGITLHDLHAQLSNYGLAMINVGSISDQTLAGIITTATHGSGIEYGVISTHVMGLTLLLANGTRAFCSRNERPDLFIATICGLGATGLILSVQLEVEPAFRLKEIQESMSFDDFIHRFDKLVYSAQHVRFWWFPDSDIVRCSYSDRTKEVLVSAYLISMPLISCHSSRKILLAAGGGILLWDIMSHSYSYSSPDTSCPLIRGYHIIPAG